MACTTATVVKSPHSPFDGRPGGSREVNLSARESWRVFEIMAEFVEATERLAPIRPAVSIFGSARLSPDTVIRICVLAAFTPEQLNQIVGAALPGMMLVAILLTPLLMATWFSPGLAMFEGFPPGRALWWSLWACWINWRPLLVYSLVLGALGTVALVIPFGLGMLVFLPLTLISTYVAYRMIFTPSEAVVTEAEALP